MRMEKCIQSVLFGLLIALSSELVSSQFDSQIDSIFAEAFGSNSKPILTATGVTEGPLPIEPAEIRPPEPAATQSTPCIKSKTKANRRNVCSNQLIFETTFDLPYHENWTHTVYFSEIESEFVVFDNGPENSLVRDKKLVLKPTLLEDKYGKGYITGQTLNLLERCTSPNIRDCKRSGFARDILPPVISAQLTTKDTFSFRYGIIEIKARLPEGDWVVPELWLLPKIPRFGKFYSEKIKIATVFGNTDLQNDRHEDIGNKLLTSGISLGDQQTSSSSSNTTGKWTDDFHVFKMIWDEDEITSFVDDKKIETFKLDLIRRASQPPKERAFREEFYVVLGLHVGGDDFPDGSINRGIPKIWQNKNQDRLVKFFLNLDRWHSTWSRQTSMEIEYVKIWSL